MIAIALRAFMAVVVVVAALVVWLALLVYAHRRGRPGRVQRHDDVWVVEMATWRKPDYERARRMRDLGRAAQRARGPG